MKKIILILLLLIFIPVVFAECPPDCNYNSPDVVNNLEPQDLASAINEGRITDMTIVDDNRLADALSNNPSISTKLEDRHLARAVNQDLSLLDNPSVMSDFDSRAQSDTHILNDNPNIKKKWFMQYQINDNGAELDSYDGTIVRTRGTQATSFDINKHPNALVFPDGSLQMGGYGGYGFVRGGNIIVADDGQINVNNGDLEFHSYTTFDYNFENPIPINVNGGTITINGEGLGSNNIDKYLRVGNLRYESEDSSLKVIINGRDLTVLGENIIESNSLSGEIKSKFSGEIKYDWSGGLIFSKGTEYELFIDGKSARKYEVQGMTHFYNPEYVENFPTLYAGNNYIADSGTDVLIRVINGNDIKILSNDDSLQSLRVDEIKDGSSVVFNDNGKVEMTFTKDPVTVKGDMTQLKTNVESYFTNADGEQYRQLYTNKGGVVQCSSERVCEFRDERYLSNVDIIRDEQGNIISERYSDGYFYSYERDENGNIISQTSPSGTTTYELDNSGNVVRTTYPDGSYIIFERDENGNAIRETYPDGTYYTMTYDEQGNHISRISSSGYVVYDDRQPTYELDNSGNVVRTTYPDGSYIIFERDENGNAIRETYPDGTYYTMTYDEQGNHISRISSSGYVVYDDRINSQVFNVLAQSTPPN